MQPRRQLIDIPPDVLEDLKNASLPPNKVAARFSNKQLQDDFHLSLEGGGLVSIHGKVYAFVEDPDDTNQSYILGKGGFGKVKFLQNIEDSSDQKALKVFHRNENTEPEDEKKFKHELHIAALLGRGFPHLIEKPGENGQVSSYCGVLDLAPGDNLTHWIDTKELHAEQRLKIACACFKEIQLMHVNGCLHNDVHARNFKYDARTDTVKVVDFGSAMEYDSRNNSKRDVHALGSLLEELFGIDDEGLNPGSLVAKQIFQNLYPETQQRLRDLIQVMHDGLQLDNAIKELEDILSKYQQCKVEETKPPDSAQPESKDYSSSTTYLMSQSSAMHLGHAEEKSRDQTIVTHTKTDAENKNEGIITIEKSFSKSKYESSNLNDKSDILNKNNYNNKSLQDNLNADPKEKPRPK